jgi:hypothetical protein
MIKNSFIVLSLFLLLPAELLAEVYQCNGVWTSTPCDGARVIAVPTRTALSDTEREAREKRSLVQDSELAMLRERNDAGVDVNVTDVIVPLQKMCSSAEVSRAQCEEEVAKARESFASKVKKLSAARKIDERSEQEPREEEVGVAVSGPGEQFTVSGSGKARTVIQSRPAATQAISTGTRVRIAPRVGGRR